MKKVILIIISLFFLLSISYSQEKLEKKYKQNLIGINIGSTTGIGFSFKHWQNNLGVQISGLPVKINNDFDYSIGLTGFYSIKRKKHFNMFVYTGHNLMTKNFDFIIEMLNPLYSILDTKYLKDTPNYNASIGFGTELGKNPIFTVKFGYGAFSIFKQDNFFPTVEIALHFKLK